MNVCYCSRGRNNPADHLTTDFKQTNWWVRPSSASMWAGLYNDWENKVSNGYGDGLSWMPAIRGSAS